MSVCFKFQLSSWSRTYFSGRVGSGQVGSDDGYRDNRATAVQLGWDLTELGKKFMEFSIKGPDPPSQHP